MNTYYADLTEFKSNKEAKTKDVVVLGGILISNSEEQKLSTLIRQVKTKYVNPDMPIKYNFKDLKPVYESFNLLSEFDNLLKKSRDWRKEIVELSLQVDYKIIIAIIKNFQSHKAEQKSIRSQLHNFAFSDVLMRVAMEVKRNKLKPACVILDWPESNNPKPFNSAYYYGYWRGKTCNDQEYYSGTLKSLEFHDTVLFASANHSNMLQFSDLIIGAMKDFLDTELNSREYSIGKELSEIFISKLNGFPKKMNYGLSVSSNNFDFNSRIKKMLEKYAS